MSTDCLCDKTYDSICTVCPVSCHLVFRNGEITGNMCERGYTYMMDEIVSPKRNISSTVKINSSLHVRLPVKTSKAVDRDLLIDCTRQLDSIEVSAPIAIGDIVLENVLGTGANFVATRSILS